MTPSRAFHGLSAIMSKSRKLSQKPERPKGGYTWTNQQIECATDIMFKQPGDLEFLYDDVIRATVFSVKLDNMAAFLGQRITLFCQQTLIHALF